MRNCSRSAQSLVVILSCGLAACMDYQDAESPSFGGAAGSPAVASIQAPLEQEAPVTLDVSSDTSVRGSNPNINFGTTPTIDINRGLLQVKQSVLAGAVAPTDYVISAVLRVSLVPDGSRRVSRLPFSTRVSVVSLNMSSRSLRCTTTFLRARSSSIRPGGF